MDSVLFNALRKKYGNCAFRGGKIYVKNKELDLTKEEFAQIKSDFVMEELKNEAQKSLQVLCDQKSKEVKAYLAGKDVVTEEQLVRYEEKYDVAVECLNGNQELCDRLKLEADLRGVSIEELAQNIKTIGDEWKQKLVEFNSRIEAFRIKVQELIDNGEIDRVKEIIKKAEELGVDATDEDVKVLFE